MTSSRLSALAAVVFAAACGSPTTEIAEIGGPPDGGAVLFAPREISAESGECAVDDSRCARVEVQTLRTAAGGTEAVRENIDVFLEHDLISRMRSVVPEDAGNRAVTADALAAEFLAQHRAFVADFPDATAGWSFEVSVDAVTNTETVVTLDITEFTFTGGAHPNTRRRLVSFDVATGRLLDAADLTRDVDELAARVEAQLRSDRGLGPEDDLEAAGFWLPEGGFSLPDNVAVVADGIHVHWDAYEIAPYAMGPIDVVVPVSELAAIAEPSYWPASTVGDRP
jgi:hypothetical protein